MYTLRFRRDYMGQPGYASDFMPDHYVCNLAADELLAIEKGRAYVDAFRARVGETDTFSIVFDGEADREIYKRRGKLSVNETRKLELAESGVFPFGKHKDKSVGEVDRTYVLYWADQAGKGDLDPVLLAIVGMCQGYAVENGLFEARQVQREARRVVDMKSVHIGTVGERRDFVGVLEYVSQPLMGDRSEYHVNRIRCGDDLVVYFGKALGEKGSTIKFRATVKSHPMNDGVKETQINRPTES
ncbi:hypothetical protein [Paraburkholderia sp. GAS32]|uniref:hypothetical protein n=1 Tax=Paraburkholderia sp. GAS32 TaxID=3035129 RepID=UPI003D196AEA